MKTYLSTLTGRFLLLTLFILGSYISRATCSASFTYSGSGLTYTFTNTSTSSGGMANVYYSWNFMDGGTSTLKDPVVTFSSIGARQVFLTIYDSSTHCSSWYVDTICIGGTCQAGFTMADSGLTVTFTNTSLNPLGNTTGLTSLWIFSDGTWDYNHNPVKSFSTPGWKYIMLRVFDSISQCHSYFSDSIFLSTGTTVGCVASFSKTIASQGTSIMFTNSSVNYNGTANGLSYLWDFGDGTSSSLKNPVKTYLTYGFKTVTLTISDSLSGCLASITDTFTTSFISQCKARLLHPMVGPLTIRFINTSTNTISLAPGLTSYWNFSDGSSAITNDSQVNIYKTFTTPGVKWVKLTIVDSVLSCYDSIVDTFMVYPNACSASFTATASGGTVTINNTSVGVNGTASDLTYGWAFEDINPNPTQKNPVVTYYSGGWKRIWLQVRDSAQVCFSEYEDSVFINLPCQASFLFPLIAPQTIGFINTSTYSGGGNGLNYYWQFSDSTTSTSASPVKTFTPGIHWARLDISDSATSCYSTQIDSFLIEPDTCMALFNKVISGSTVTFTNTSIVQGTTTGFSSFWSFGDGTTSGATHPVKTYSTNGTYIVILHVTDSTCSSFYTDTVVINNASPLCNASFVVAVDTLTPFHFYLLNTSTITTTSNFLWTFGDGDSSTAMTPSHSYATFGVYYVCLTVYDSLCSSTYCDSIGMDSNGTLYKNGAFGFQVLNYTQFSTATKEIAKIPEYKLYPNPFNNHVNIEFNLSATMPITLKLYDVSGKELMTKTMNGISGLNMETIELNEYQSGIYFLNIGTTDGRRNYKLIKH